MGLKAKQYFNFLNLNKFSEYGGYASARRLSILYSTTRSKVFGQTLDFFF